MALVWSNWEPRAPETADTSPYVDWYRTVTFDGQIEKDGLSLAPLPQAASVGGALAPAPLPPFARPGDGETPNADPEIQLTWMPDPDAAIVGVIDSAIALSNARFRRIDGGSRFLSAWLQAGNWRANAAVPFGRELFRTEIDRLMWRHKIGEQVDECAFDRAAGATQFAHTRGDRRLEKLGTHGTHVTDLAAGFDLTRADLDEARRRLPLIAVGLPPRSCIGSSGNFLEFYAIHAVDYILDRADRIWAACDHGEGHFPVVINLSYGLQAGPKDGQMLIEKVIAEATRRAEADDRVIRVVLPAGNDLLSEGTATFEVSETASTNLTWRLAPEDHTPNYAEVWSDVLPGVPDPTQSHPLIVSLATPGGPLGPSGPGRANQTATLTDSAYPTKPLARIYCHAQDDAPLDGTTPATRHRMAYVLCTRPTLNEARTQITPAGGWTLNIIAGENGGSKRGWAHVQSDQSLTHGSETGLTSTFNHPDFDAHDATGRLIDTHDYPTDASTPNLTDTTPPVTRRSTMNAIAYTSAARVIGSYRKTDGKPSLFSSAASSGAPEPGRAAPTALLPGEDGASRFGLIASGSKSGSTIAMEGTSFSTALATRRIALALLDWIDGGKIGPAPGHEAWFQSLAQAEDAAAAYPGQTTPEKAGAGRMNGPDTGRIAR